ncbi:MAG: glycosyltransferase family 4 protein [Candidatus Paceibacterota bacterium]
MRVGFVTNSSGNTAQYRLPWIKCLEQRGYSVTVFSPGGDELRRSGVRHIPWEVDRYASSLLGTWREITRLARLLKQERIDVVQSFTPKGNFSGTLAAWLAGVPITVSTVTGLGVLFTNPRPSLRTRLVRAVFRAVVSRSGFLVFQNADDERVFARTPASRRYSIHGSGVDPERFRPADPAERAKCRERFGFQTGHHVFVYTGRLVRSKGILELCAAGTEVIRRGYPLTLVCAGEIEKENPDSLTEQEVAALTTDAIQFPGFRRDVRELLCAADGLVFPSYREGVPFPVVEAMLMEKPVITTDVPGCRDTIEHKKSGLLVDRGSVAQLTEALVWLMTHPDDARRMGEAGRRRSLEVFALPPVLEELDRLYDAVARRYNERHR